MRYAILLLGALFVCVIFAGSGALLFQASEMGAIGDAGFASLGVGGDIDGEDLYGNELKLSEYRGKVVLLFFWSSGNELARLQQTHVKRLQQKFNGQPFVVVGVNGDASRSQAQAVAEKNDYDYHSWYDGPRGPISQKWLVFDGPTFYLISHKGEVMERYDNLFFDFAVEQDIARLLRAATAR